MATVKIVDQTNKEVGDIELAPEVFEVEVKPELLHLVVRQHLAARRAGTHATKNRAKITGGGKKPWRQKGTGRARAGSVRSPLWRGGATTFGPQPRNYGFKLNKKVRRLALRMALSSKLGEDALTVVKAMDLPEIKTKDFVKIAKDLDLGKALVVLGEQDEKLAKSARNIPGITLVQADKLNVYDVLKHPRLVLLENALSGVEERLK